MESLQARKEKAIRELKEIETLESQHAILNKEAEKLELVERFLTDLRNAPLACALPLSSVAHVKSVFRQPACKQELCGYFETCQSIINLTGKQSPVKRSKSSGGTGKVKLAEVPLKTARETGAMTFTQNGRSFSFSVKNGENWKMFTDKIKAQLQSVGFILSAGQIQGIGHKGAGNKYETLVMGL